MENDWGWGRDPNGDSRSGDGGRPERVVPAAGDPEVPFYQERMRQARGIPPRSRFAAGPLSPPGRGLRWWLTLTGVAIALLLLIKPLVALLALAVALVVGLVALGLLAGGALWLAVRFALGGRYPYGGIGVERRGLWPWLAGRAARRARTRQGRYR